MTLSFGPWRQFVFSLRLGFHQAYRRLNYHRALEYDLAARLCDPKDGLRVLDAGSGYVNSLSLYLASQSTARMTALDSAPYDPSVAESVRAQMESAGCLNAYNEGRLQVLQGDMRKLPFDDSSFDRVLAISCLEHLDKGDDATAAREIGRVLAKGGRAVVSVPFSRTEPIESESWGGPEYTQRHYNWSTLKTRIIDPSGLTVRSARLVGERWPGIGRTLIRWPKPLAKIASLALLPFMPVLWKIYYRQDEGPFFESPPAFSADAREKAGLIVLTLVKADNTMIQTAIAPARAGYRPSYEKVRILSVGLTDDDGAAKLVFASGEPARVSVRFENESRAVDPVIRIQIHKPDGTLMVGANTRRAGLSTIRPEGQGSIELRFEALNLLAGSYLLCAGVFDDPDVLDRPLDDFDPANEILRFEMTSSPEQGGGIALCPHSWNWPQKQNAD